MEVSNPTRVLRFFTKIIVGLDDECWRWTGAIDSDGYGNFTVGKGKTNKAHIFSWVFHFGPIPAGLQVDHKCNHTWCVNPNCLQLLLGKYNNERSTSPSAVNKRKTHCKHGHLFSEENTRISCGKRYCITCEKERGR